MKNMKLPKIAMGAWSWGDTDGYFGNTMKEDEFFPIFEASLNNGLNLWDTATAYSNGESEKILGHFVNKVGRENVIVSTKFTPQMAGMYEKMLRRCVMPAWREWVWTILISIGFITQSMRQSTQKGSFLY